MGKDNRIGVARYAGHLVMSICTIPIYDKKFKSMYVSVPSGGYVYVEEAL